MTKREYKPKNPILLEFAKKIKIRRYELGLTQEQLAEKADFDVNFIGGIERAIRNLPLTSIIKLAKALKVNAKYFIP